MRAPKEGDAVAYLLDRSSLSGGGSLFAFRTAVNPLRRAIPASRKPWHPSLYARATHASHPWTLRAKLATLVQSCTAASQGSPLRCAVHASRKPRGDHPWPSVRRVRRTLGEPARRMRRARVLHALENK